MQILTLRDESIGGDLLHTIELRVENELMTVRELIAARVRLEVDKYNAAVENTSLRTLVQPTEAEAQLNAHSYQKRGKKFVDAEKQVFVALDAFQKNRFFILVNDQQVSDLEENILVDEVAKISFLRLMPLVGG